METMIINIWNMISLATMYVFILVACIACIYMIGGIVFVLACAIFENVLTPVWFGLNNQINRLRG